MKTLRPDTRLRNACLFLHDLCDEIEQFGPCGMDDPTHVPEFAIKAIRKYEEDNLLPGDLTAIRQAPHSHHPSPYYFLWLLHRYQNNHAH